MSKDDFDLDDFDFEEEVENKSVPDESKEDVEVIGTVVKVAAASAEEVKEEKKPIKITREDNVKYDKDLSEFLEQKKKELKGKVNGQDTINSTISVKDTVENNKVDSSDSNPNSSDNDSKDNASDNKVSENKDGAKTKETKRAPRNKVKEPDKTSENVKTINDKIAAQEKKINKLENQLEEFKASNTVIIDSQNTDDKKKLKQLFDEGKIIVDKSNKPFILVDVPIDNTQCVTSVTHTVYCEDITSVDIHSYYLDLSLDIFDRKFVKKIIWVFHKGYHTCDLITEEQLQYLIDNKFVTKDMINYFVVDKLKGKSYYNGHDEKDITKEAVEELDKHDAKNVVKNSTIDDEEESFEE